MLSHWDYSVLDTAIHANGGTLLNEDYTEATLDTPTNIETIQWWVDLIHTHKVAPLPAEFGEAGIENFFASGKVAMATLGVWAIATLREQDNFQWDIAMMPKGKAMQTAVQWPNQVAISAKTAHPDEAFDYALFAIRPDRPADTVGIGKVPVVKDLAYSEVWMESGKPPAHKDAILKMGDLNVPLEFGFRWNEWRGDVMNQELQLSFLGERSVDESVAAAQAAIQAVLDRP
jgi:multiple sugar transport system substrate-binding protein